MSGHTDDAADALHQAADSLSIAVREMQTRLRELDAYTDAPDGDVRDATAYVNNAGTMVANAFVADLGVLRMSADRLHASEAAYRAGLEEFVGYGLHAVQNLHTYEDQLRGRSSS